MGSELLKLSVAVLLGIVIYVNGQAPAAAPAAPVAPAPLAPAPGASQQLATGRRPPPPPSGGGGGGSEALNPLPAGAETIIGSLRPGFSCDGKVYGYYADIANDCKVFHVCWPITDERGATINKHWIFVCGNQTQFNQERLTCDRPENVDCANSEKWFVVNNDFGKIPGAR